MLTGIEPCVVTGHNPRVPPIGIQLSPLIEVRRLRICLAEPRVPNED